MIWIENCRDLTEDEIKSEVDKAFDMILESTKEFKQKLDDIQANNRKEENVIENLLSMDSLK
jgi:hypothetical protein